MATTKKTTKKAAPKAAVKAKTVKKKATKKTAATKSSAGAGKIKVTQEQHYKMICEAAYYISLERTHDTVNPDEDWIQAEAAINKICTIS